MFTSIDRVASDFFGESVVMSDDVLVVGADGATGLTDTGAVYVFQIKHPRVSPALMMYLLD